MVVVTKAAGCCGRQWVAGVWFWVGVEVGLDGDEIWVEDDDGFLFNYFNYFYMERESYNHK